MSIKLPLQYRQNTPNSLEVLEIIFGSTVKSRRYYPIKNVQDFQFHRITK